MDSDDHKATSEKASDEEGGNKVIIRRSYECNFCKRGFSIAQALGGHMNIHRKHKAKIKQTPSNSLDIHHKVNSSVEEQTKPIQWPCHHVVRIRQLPLFSDSPVVSCEMQTPQYCEIPDKNIGIEESEMALPCSQGSSSELDLELRLGPHPEDSSPMTRKFF
ncbi:hypothetical protein VNO77_29053 [Canavalia gladiata]|uniref:C2H2-type domain-containing protein n=1 Tax=Canavalia gladiata TaxID=3824 RepID=A0AAN9KZX3_CANGL